MPSSHSDIPYGSLLNYIPRGNYDQAAQAKQAVGRTKAGDDKAIEYLISLIESRPLANNLKEFIGSGALIVPVPRSSLIKPDSVWPSKLIAEELAKQGYGKEARYAIERHAPIRTSSQQAAANRPSIKEHTETLRVVMPPQLGDPKVIILVDDVVSKGSTVLACAEILQKAYPDYTIKIFTIARTRFESADEFNALDPHVGVIRYYPSSGLCYRDP